MSTQQYIEEKKEEKVNKMTQDQEEKLLLVIEKIQEHCSHQVDDDSEHEDLCKVSAALRAGRNLQGKILAGGYTNYSYKIFLDGGDHGNDDTVVLFAKVAFAEALWCKDQDKPCDLNRQTCEFNLMKEFSDKMGGPGVAPIATPYLLIDVSSNVRMLVSQWAPADEQWGNQFIEGEVDRRILPKVAETLATINLSEFDPTINKGMKDDLQNLLGGFGTVIDGYFKQEGPKDDFVDYLQKMGRENFHVIDAARIENDAKEECLVHGDAHVFNCLVEAKPDIRKLDQFGEKGSFYLCDWEMARPSSRGHDIGLILTFPIMCSYFHAAQGHTDKALDIIDCLKELWQHYARNLAEKGDKDEEYIATTFRACLASCGSFIVLAFYAFGCFTEFVNKDGLSPDDIDRVMGKVGLTGLKFMEAGFTDLESPCTTSSLGNFLDTFHEITNDTINNLSTTVGVHQRQTRRRSSILRASGRRASDASIRGEALRRNSARIVG